MSYPRIEQAEILSLHLVVPLPALDQLVQSCPLPLVLERSERGAKLSHERCWLSFRREGEMAQLSGAQIQADPRGEFFRDVLCALMTEHAGDLHAKLAWRAPDREGSLGSAEVRIRRGQAETTVHPLLRNVVEDLRAAAQPLFERGETAPAQAAEPQGPAAAPPPLDEDVVRLLDDARKHYAEYLRLRRERTGG